MHLYKRIVFGLFVFLIIFNNKYISEAYSQENSLHIDSIPIANKMSYEEYLDYVWNCIYILEDPGGKLSIEEASSPELMDEYIHHPDFKDFKKDHVYWARLTFDLGDEDSASLFIIPQWSDYFEFYAPGTDGFEVLKTGYFRPSSENDELVYDSNALVLEMKDNKLDSTSLSSVYIRFYDHDHTIPELIIYIWDLESGIYRVSRWLERGEKHERFNGMIYGILGLIFLISIILFITQKQKEYILYSMYILFITVFMITMGGTMFKNLRQLDFLFLQLSGITAVFFYFRFLLLVVDYKELPRFLVRLFKSFNYTYLVLVCIIIVFLVVLKSPGNVYNFTIIPAALVYLLPVIIVNVVLLGSKIFLNRLFSIGSLILFVSFIYMALGVLINLPEGYTVIRLAIVAQVLTFAYLLVYKMRMSEKQRLESQEKLVVQLQENEKLQEKVNRELEQKVKERTQEIVQQKEEIETQRDDLARQRDLVEGQKQEITDSITYARRIQTAVLPSTEELEELLPEHFVLFKPRDIVSGDFYWIKQIKNFTILVAADCTGHGVPGAFMSMLGVSMLNEIVGRSRLDSAGEFLDRLRQKVKTTLSQEGKEMEQKDGMDMGLAILDKESNEMQYAGAFNPIYIVRKASSSKDKELESFKSLEEDGRVLYEVKGDRQPISIYLQESNFKTNYIKLKKDDTLYMFSDGYADQIGGPNEKKFMIKTFKKLLLGIQNQSMLEQKKILDSTLEEWKQEVKQVDDILVFGIRR